MKINDAILGAVFLLLGVVVLVHVQAFPRIPGQQVGPGLFPGLISAGLAVCGALLMVSGIRHRAAEPWFETADWMRARRKVIAFFVIIIGVAAYVVLAEKVGFLLLAPALLFLWFSALGVRPRPAVVVALVATLVIWYAFYKLLRVPLPWGVLSKFAF